MSAGWLLGALLSVQVYVGTAFSQFKLLPSPPNNTQAPWYDEAFDSHRYEEPMVHCFSDGQCVAVFEQFASDGRTLYTTVSHDHGKVWSVPTRVFFDSNSIQPKLSCLENHAAAQKVCVMTWDQYDSLDVWTARSIDGGITWTHVKEAPLYGSEHGRKSLPDIACFYAPDVVGSFEDTFNCLVLVFSEKPNEPLMLVRSDDGGRQFHSPKPILECEKNSVGKKFVRVDCTWDGSLCLAVFNGDEREDGTYSQTLTYPNQLLTTMRSTDGGRQWSSISTVELSERTWHRLDSFDGYRNVRIGHPVVRCLDAHRCVVACHIEISDTERWIETSWTEDGGESWSQSQPLFVPSDRSADEVALACYGHSTCILTWEMDEDYKQVPMFSISEDAGKTWSTPDVFRGLPVKFLAYEMFNDVDLSCTNAGYCVAIYEASGVTQDMGERPSIAVSYLNVSEYEGVNATLSPTPFSGETQAPTAFDGGIKTLAPTSSEDGNETLAPTTSDGGGNETSAPTSSEVNSTSTLSPSKAPTSSPTLTSSAPSVAPTSPTSRPTISPTKRGEAGSGDDDDDDDTVDPPPANAANEEPPRTSNLPLIVGLSAGGALLVGIGSYYAYKKYSAGAEAAGAMTAGDGTAAP